MHLQDQNWEDTKYHLNLKNNGSCSSMHKLIWNFQLGTRKMFWLQGLPNRRQSYFGLWACCVIWSSFFISIGKPKTLTYRTENLVNRSFITNIWNPRAKIYMGIHFDSQYTVKVNIKSKDNTFLKCMFFRLVITRKAR